MDVGDMLYILAYGMEAANLQNLFVVIVMKDLITLMIIAPIAAPKWI